MDEAQGSYPEDDVAIAREAIAEGNLAHATAHLAWALATDPQRREWLDLFDEIIDAAPEPLSLAPLDGEPSFAIVAARAYIAARLGRQSEAIALLLRVYPVRPDVPYLEWADDWLKVPGVIDALDIDMLSGSLGRLLGAFPGIIVADLEQRARLERLLPFVSRLRHAHLTATRRQGIRHHDEPTLLQFEGTFFFTIDALYRKTGRLDEALALANESLRALPCYATHLGLAIVHRARGEVDDALKCYRATAAQNSEDTAALSDAAAMLAEHRRFDEAEQLYTEALARDPADAKALPGYCYLRFFSSSGDLSWLERLRDLVEQDPTNAEARRRLCWLTPFFGFLPEPHDAFVNLCRPIAEGKAANPTGAVTTLRSFACTALEAPSAYLAYKLLFDEPDKVDLPTSSVGEIQEPDPRQPRRPVPYQLWRYEGTTPIAVLPAPPADVAQDVATIAGRSYDLEQWATIGGSLGERLGTDRVDDLLGVMVHPPLPSSGIVPWEWLLRVQLAASLALARVDVDWEHSLRRKVLLALLDGPMDWTVSTAAVALTLISRESPEIEQEVHQALCDRLASRPTSGYTCYALPVVYCLMELPSVAGEERQQLRALCRELEAV